MFGCPIPVRMVSMQKLQAEIFEQFLDCYACSQARTPPKIKNFILSLLAQLRIVSSMIPWEREQWLRNAYGYLMYYSLD